MVVELEPEGAPVEDIPAFGLDLSDEELRRYEFDIERPELITNYTKVKPFNDKFVRAIKSYSIPHQKHSRTKMAWCCYCQEHNHYDGGLAEYESGAVRSVGWKCGEEHLGVQFKRDRDTFLSHRTRKRYLLERDRLFEILPALRNEVAHACRLPAVAQVQALRQQFREHMPGLFAELAAAAVHHAGFLRWEEEVTDYSRIEQVRENDGNGKLAGQRTLVVPRSRQVDGYLFFDRRNDPGVLLEKLERKLGALEEFYSTTDTARISNEAFRSHECTLRRTLREFKKVESVLVAPLAFFSSENLTFIVGYYVQKRPALLMQYRTRNGVLLCGDGDDVISLSLPADYRPYRFAALRRVEFALQVA